MRRGVETRLAAGRHPAAQCRSKARPGADVTGGEWLSRWSLSMQAGGASPRTISERTRVIRRVASDSDADAAGLSEQDVEGFLASIPAQSTRATYWGTLKAWHEWLVSRDVRSDNPMRRVARPREPRRRPRPISTEQLSILLASRMHRRTRTMILLAAYAGLRVHEVAKIRGEDVDVVSGTLTVTGKGGVTEVLPLHPLLAREASVYPSHGYWFHDYTDGLCSDGHVLGNSVSRTVAAAMRRCGVDATAHQLRHWYATELLRAGADVRTVQTLMRHASLATTAIYTQVSDDRRAEGIARLPAALAEA